mmetsp:Transcript_26711/g.69241  ORF Transcript_26711/g.69241 Transcript_26711/m.69241 type:complete len:278 (+) Transcript_26711:268-1101(+)
MQLPRALASQRLPSTGGRSEQVLGLAHSGEGVQLRGAVRQAHGQADVLVVGAEKRVGGELLAQRARHRGDALLPHGLDLRRPVHERLVVGVDGQRKPGIGLGVLVSAVNHGVLGERLDLGQRRVHLLRRPLKQPPAAEHEQRVAREQRLGLREEVRDVARRVAGRLQHPHRQPAKRPLVALLQARVDARDALGVAVRAHHLAAVLGLELGIATGVVPVVVRVDDVVQVQAALLQRLVHHRELGGVHHGDLAGALLHQQPHVVVLQRREALHLQHFAC